jgi:PAS domain S-box-containing protein
MGEQALEMGAEPDWQAEVTLDRGESQFRRSLEKLPIAAYTCDPDGLITYFNPQAVQLWGRAPKLNDSEDRFCGSFKLFSANGLPVAHEQCWMALALQMKQGYNGHEIIIERPDGSRLVVLAYANPLQDASGKILGAVNLLVDITERKRAELKERLLAEVSHLLVKSLEYKVALSQLVQLVVPRLADWCVIDLTGEGKSGSPVIGHVDPTKIEMAHAWRRRLPIDWNAPEGVAQVVRTGQAELYPEVTPAMLQARTGDLEYLTLLHQLQFSSMMIVPLVAHGQIFGAMTFVWAESNNHYNEEDLALAEDLARQAAVILDNARIYQAERAARAEAEIAQQRLALLARAGEGLSPRRTTKPSSLT